ncbi:3-isopropylmalate dehydratase small subunit [Microvirga sp. BT689]|uniref:3-isopropylmalate dehydratase small subunit n=1 Tax=Microvirga arvi TaxID=2778731 RepID=UPI00195048F9|nr:3-isopropylmalate dehydratase small subunit [Microvirga arvi]MBM6583237.1 3-isopropylmalate dehydratase small subunit [Microvirga arvi]
MRQFVTVTAKAAPMPAANIDTDQIIPARFLRRPRKEGYGDCLFYDARFDEAGRERPGHVLNQERYADAQILVTGRNFGSGSSREAAVYALADYGFRAVVAPSFGDIFFNNALINGFLPVRLPEEEVSEIVGVISSDAGDNTIRIDLEKLILEAGGKTYRFHIDGLKRRCLLEGLDDIALTRTHTDEIEAFERRHFERMPWLGDRRRTAESQDRG